MTMIDSGKKDHKILAVAVDDPEYNSFREASELPPHRLTMLRRFFQDYKSWKGRASRSTTCSIPGPRIPSSKSALERYSVYRRRGFTEWP